MTEEKPKGVTVCLEGVSAKGEAGRVAAKGAVRKGPKKGKRKYSYESIIGNEFSVDGKFVYKEQIIDRENNQYKKLVVNEDTGEILRDVEHELMEHKDRGSAKKKE